MKRNTQFLTIFLSFFFINCEEKIAKKINVIGSMPKEKLYNIQDLQDLGTLIKIGKIIEDKKDETIDIRFLTTIKNESGGNTKDNNKKKNSYRKYIKKKMDFVDKKFESIFRKVTKKLYPNKNNKKSYKRFKKKFKGGMILIISLVIGILLALSILGMVIITAGAMFITVIASLTCFRTFRKLRLELFGNYKNKKREYKVFALVSFLIALLITASYLGIGFLTVPLILAGIAGIGTFRRIRLLLRGEL